MVVAAWQRHDRRLGLVCGQRLPGCLFGMVYPENGKIKTMTGLNHISLACTVCFGDPNTLSSKALVAAVFFLLGVVVFVLGSIAFTAFKWTKRAKELGH